MTIADRCEEHRCPVYNASPRRAAKRLFGGFLFPGIFPTAGKRGRIGAKLIYDQQEGENQDGNGLYCRRIYPGCRPEQIQRSVNMRSYHCSTRRKNNGGRHPADENGVWRVTKNSGELGAQGAGRAGMALALRLHHIEQSNSPESCSAFRGIVICRIKSPINLSGTYTRPQWHGSDPRSGCYRAPTHCSGGPVPRWHR